MIGRRILVAWRSSREAARAVNDALPLLATAEAVDLVVVNPTSEHDVRDYGEEPGASIAAHLARHGISVEVLRERAVGESVGKRLLACAAGRGADLIVLGAYGHSVCVSWFLAASHNTCSIMPHYRS
jgi:nucleotide-binding universal stress UspA family protein